MFHRLTPRLTGCRLYWQSGAAVALCELLYRHVQDNHCLSNPFFDCLNFLLIKKRIVRVTVPGPDGGCIDVPVNTGFIFATLDL